MMKWIIDWLIRRIVSSEAVGMNEQEQYEILLRVKEIEGFGKLLRALTSSEIANYFGIPEDNKEMRWIKKGSVLRLRWLRMEMERAQEKLETLNKEKKNDQTQE